MTATTIKKPASVRLPARLNSALLRHAKQLKVSKESLARQAIEEFLQTEADLETVKARRSEPTIPHGQFWKNLGLEG
jgi:predicted transcriptional regulator